MRIRSLFMFLTILLIAGCSDPSADTKPPTTAAVTPAELQVTASTSVKSGLTYIGVVLTSETVNLSSELRGRLEEVSVRPGDQVRRGMAVATIQPLDLPEQLVSAEAAVQMARSAVSQAETALRLAKERVTRVSAAPEVFSEEERSVATGNHETAEKELESARARLVQAQSEVRRLRGQSERRVLRAPADGWIAARLLDPGALVEAGQPVLRLKGSERYLLRFAVPPTEVGRWSAGQPIRWYLENSELSFPAVVARIAQQVDPASQMVFLEADLDPAAAPGLLRDGLVVRVEPVSPTPPAPDTGS